MQQLRGALGIPRIAGEAEDQQALGPSALRRRNMDAAKQIAVPGPQLQLFRSERQRAGALDRVPWKKQIGLREKHHQDDSSINEQDGEQQPAGNPPKPPQAPR